MTFDTSFQVDSLFVGQVADQCRALKESDRDIKGEVQPTSRISKVPTVSVILPTYNRAHLLPRAILSILNQTYQNFELIIVDDASTDETPRVVKAFDDPRIRYIRHEHNKGASAARNTGIEASRGTYIAFQDSDDEWLPYKLARQVPALTQSPPEVGVVYSSFWLVRGNEKSIYPSRIRKLSRLLPSEARRLNGDIHRALSRGNFITTQVALVRRACFETVGLFDERLSRFQDWELWLRISEHYHFNYIDEPLVVAYATPGNLSSDQSACIEAFDIMLHKHHHEAARENTALLAHYLNARGDMLFRRGDRKRGQTQLFRAVKVSPLNTAYWVAALTSLLGQGIYTKATNVLGVGYTRH
jgi:glycosyltransferase involved in cell wall biosynthesis